MSIENKLLKAQAAAQAAALLKAQTPNSFRPGMQQMPAGSLQGGSNVRQPGMPQGTLQQQPILAPGSQPVIGSPSLTGQPQSGSGISYPQLGMPAWAEQPQNTVPGMPPQMPMGSQVPSGSGSMMTPAMSPEMIQARKAAKAAARAAAGAVPAPQQAIAGYEDFQSTQASPRVKSARPVRSKSFGAGSQTKWY